MSTDKPTSATPSELVKRIRAYSYKDADDVEQLESDLAAAPTSLPQEESPRVSDGHIRSPRVPSMPPAAAAPDARDAANPAQRVPAGMWYFTFYCEDYDSVQRVRVGADAPRQFTCGVTGITKTSAIDAALAADAGEKNG